MALRVCPLTWSEGSLPGALAVFLLLLFGVAAAPPAGADPPATPRPFDIPAEELAEALDRFSEQSGIQIAYDQKLIVGRRSQRVQGEMPAAEALRALLAGSGLVWEHVNDNTVVFVRSSIEPPPGVVTQPRAPESRSPNDIVELEHYVTIGARFDPMGLLPVEPIDSVFGFDKSLLTTPRSVSVLGDELMNSYGVESALDVSKVVPSTFTTSIFGINGNVNIRGVTSDTYFRGVKRLENTQLFPSPITAMSRLDVVRGPPSPIYGPGKLGGYTNFVPKSARASTGKYLDRPSGKAVLTLGSYDKKALSGEIGGPFRVLGRRGGYYVYANVEDSNTYYENVPFKQRILQSSFDYELGERVRFELGQMYQFWGGTELAGWNRVTQELVDHGTYNAGQMKLNMDVDGDGLISTAEVDSFGPLLLTFASGTAPDTVEGRLADNWAVDPATVRKASIRRTANSQSPEDGGRAHVNLAYFDVIARLPNEATLTAKTYFEHLERYKWTRASAFGQDTRSSVFEQKILYQQPFVSAREGAGVNFAASAMYRRYDTRNLTGTRYSDLVNRADLSQPFSPLNRFAVPNLEPELAPWNTGLESVYTTIGAGALIDATWDRTNFIAGARYDMIEDIHSRVPDYVLTTPGLEALGSDGGMSWSVSLSHAVAKGVHPYISYARQQTLVYGIDGGIQIVAVPNALNTSELREVGIKASLLEDRLFATLAAFRQTRTSFSTETAQVPSIRSRGLEMDVRWAATRRLGFSAGGALQRAWYVPSRTATTSVSPAFFGLDDVFYGGRLQATVSPNGEYTRRSGYPDLSLNLGATCLITKQLSLNLSGSYQDAVPAGRIRNVTLPSVAVFGAALVYDTPRFTLRLAANNLTNELYFTPNSPDVVGEMLVIPAPERGFQTSFSLKL
jgi:iron complex outermembrane receptor protein